MGWAVCQSFVWGHVERSSRMCCCGCSPVPACPTGMAQHTAANLVAWLVCGWRQGGLVSGSPLSSGDYPAHHAPLQHWRCVSVLLCTCDCSPQSLVSLMLPWRYRRHCFRLHCVVASCTACSSRCGTCHTAAAALSAECWLDPQAPHSTVPFCSVSTSLYEIHACGSSGLSTGPCSLQQRSPPHP